MMERKFDTDGDAEAWLKEHGYTIGAPEGMAPRAIFRNENIPERWGRNGWAPKWLAVEDVNTAEAHVDGVRLDGRLSHLPAGKVVVKLHDYDFDLDIGQDG